MPWCGLMTGRLEPPCPERLAGRAMSSVLDVLSLRCLLTAQWWCSRAAVDTSSGKPSGRLRLEICKIWHWCSQPWGWTFRQDRARTGWYGHSPGWVFRWSRKEVQELHPVALQCLEVRDMRKNYQIMLRSGCTWRRKTSNEQHWPWYTAGMQMSKIH